MIERNEANSSNYTARYSTNEVLGQWLERPRGNDCCLIIISGEPSRSSYAMNKLAAAY